jgi:hypothetical protein
MAMKRCLSVVGLLLIFAPALYAQKPRTNNETDPRTTQAYCMLIERRAKVQAHLETLLSEYSSSWPDARKFQAEFDALKLEMTKMSEMNELMIPKLTSGYGMLILRKTALIGETQLMLQEEGSQWPPLKEKQRELELLDMQIQKLSN